MASRVRFDAEAPGARMEERIARRAERKARRQADAPPGRHAQPPGVGSLRVTTFSFDDAHPARADEHFLRTADQDEALRVAEQALAQSRALRASTGSLRPASARPAAARGRPPSKRPLSASLDATRRPAGRAAHAMLGGDAYVERLERVVDNLASSVEAARGVRASGGSLDERIASLEETTAALRASADPGTSLADHLAEGSARPAAAPQARDGDPATAADDGATLADHLASTGPTAEEAARAALAAEAQDAVAHARYERERYEAYITKLNATYERQLELGLAADDPEQDDDPEGAVAAARRKAVAEEAAEAAAEEAAAAELRERYATWEDENEWMDEYRTGARGARTHATRTSAERDATMERIAAEAAVGIEAAREAAVRARMELADEGGYPLAYMSDGGRDHSSGVYYDASGNRRIKMKKPFSFVDRPKKKTISQVKMEQDLVLKHMAEEAELKKRFVANDVPYSSRDRNRYERLEYERYMRSLANKEKAAAELMAGEKTFSFWARDMEKIDERKNISERAAAERAKRFQRKFTAKAPPPTTHSNLWEKQTKAEQDRQEVKQRRQEAYEARKVAAAAAAAAGVQADSVSSSTAPGSAIDARIAARKSRSSSARPQSFVRAFKAKEPPDWKRVHENLALKDLERRSKIKITQPQEFPQGGSRLFQSKQSAYEEEFGHPALRPWDDPTLAEMRFPFTQGGRTKVRPTPPPKEDAETKMMREQEYASNMNHAAKLRVQTVDRQRRSGRFDTLEEREKRAQDEEKALMRRRKKLTGKMLKELARQRDGGDFGEEYGGGTASTADGGAKSWEDYAPHQHMDALRHQAAREGETLVREVLEDVGALKYMEDTAKA